MTQLIQRRFMSRKYIGDFVLLLEWTKVRLETSFKMIQWYPIIGVCQILSVNFAITGSLSTMRLSETEFGSLVLRVRDCLSW